MDSINKSFGAEYIDSAVNNSDGIIDEIVLKTYKEDEITPKDVAELVSKFKKVDDDIIGKWLEEQRRSDKNTLKQSSLMVHNLNIKTEESAD